MIPASPPAPRLNQISADLGILTDSAGSETALERIPLRLVH